MSRRRARQRSTVARNCRLIDPEMYLLLVPVALVALAGTTFTVWAIVGESPIVGWVGPVMLLGSAPTTVMLGYFMRLEATPLPALCRQPFEATVTGFSPLDTDGDFEADHPALVDVRFQRDGRTVDAVTVDVIPPDARPRFSLGSRWSVYDFQDHNGRVVLTEAHDDVPRGGFNLDGIRIATESHPTNKSAPGSPVLDRDFENRVGGAWV